MATSSTNSSGFKTFQATNAALGEGIRVTLDSNSQISAAGVGDNWIGVTCEPIAASGYGTVKLLGAPGTFMFRANAAIDAGDPLFAAADGEVDDAQASGAKVVPFLAVEAAGANELFEAIPADGIVLTVGAAQAATTAVGTLTTVGSNTGTAGAGLSAIGSTSGSDVSGAIMNDFKALQEDIVALGAKVDTVVTLANGLRTALIASGFIKGGA